MEKPPTRLSKEEIREEYGKMQRTAKNNVAQVYRHVSSQAVVYNNRWQNEVTNQYHLELANKCQVVVNLLPHSLNKWYKDKVSYIFVELERYFRDCGIEGRRLAKGPETYETFKNRIEAIW